MTTSEQHVFGPVICASFVKNRSMWLWESSAGSGLSGQLEGSGIADGGRVQIIESRSQIGRITG